ncbi:MAG: inverse autotransporter beta domain-containing protein [Simkaniaceae bacterium]|nr:MAG: inverse autotransporter beta domain-containing protein [Simkaniaceae bacterium]
MKKAIAILSMLFLSLGLTLEAVPSFLPPNASDCVDETPSRVTVRHREHKGVGYDTGYTTLEAFLTPNWVRNFQPYADIRGHVMNDGKLATNIGFGARGAPIEELAIGGNFFFDYREVSSMPSYQLGSGLELLSPYVDFRLNGYLPVGHKTHTSQARFDRFRDNNISLKQRAKASLASIYAEVGGWIPKLPDDFQLYVAAGPYYLGSRHIKMVNHKTIKVGDKWGGKYRVAARIFEYFDAGIELTHDSLFHTRVQGYLGISLPLGPSRMYRGFKKRANQENCRSSRKFRQRMIQPVQRSEIIPVYKKEASFLATTEEGEPIEFVFVNQGALAGGNGTFKAPFQTLGEVESVPNNSVIVFEEGRDSKNERLAKHSGELFFVNRATGSPLTSPSAYECNLLRNIKLYLSQFYESTQQ